MDKIAALQSFFSSFLPAYEEHSIFSQPERPAYPYITYEGFYSEFDEDINASTTISFSTWYREAGNIHIYQMTDSIARSIPRTGKRIKVDNGYIVIFKESSPFGELVSDDSDDTVKRMIHSIRVMTFTV